MKKMKRFVTMLLVVSMLASMAATVSADDFVGSAVSAPTTSTVVMGSTTTGETYIAKAETVIEGETVTVSGGATKIINADHVEQDETLTEEDKTVIETAKEELVKSQEEIKANADDLTKVIPELPKETNYAVSRVEAIVSYGDDAVQVQKIVDAQAEMTIALNNEEFGYSKAAGDKVAIKFSEEGGWKLIPKEQIHYTEDGNITLTFVPESTTYQIALVKEVVDESVEAPVETEEEQMDFFGNLKKLLEKVTEHVKKSIGTIFKRGRK